MPATRALALNRVKLCILFAFLAAGASAQQPAISERGAEKGPRLSLRKGAGLQDVLRNLARATGLPVVCQAPQYQRTLLADVKDQPLPETLNEISRSYHLHWLHTPTSIVFVRRLWDERETTDIEVEELHSVAVDALRLVGPLVPVSPWDLSASVARRDFYRSLNPRQLELMQRGGLPWQGLGDSQRAAFLRLSSQNIYDDLLMDAEKAVEVYGAWNRCRLVYVRHDVRGQMKRLLCLEYPSKRDETGFSRIQVEDEPREGFSDQARPSGEFLSRETVKRPAALRAIIELTEGPIRLKALAEATGRALKGDLRVPVWAEDRELLVFGTRASAGSVLDAVALLYGWGVRRERRGEWSLGRSPVPAPRDYAEAHAALRSIVPPVARLSPRHARSARMLYEFRQIHAAITRAHGAGWQSVRVGEMSPALRRGLANHVLDAVFHEVLWESGRVELRQWLAQPELGFFTLRGEVGPGKQPEINFLVRKHIPPNTFVESGWGWQVNSSSLGD